MSDFCYFVGSSDYEPYRWHLSYFNIAMWLLIPAVFRGKLHFHWGGKQRMYDVNSGVLIPVNQRPQWREVRRLEFGLNVTWYIVMIVNCRFWLLFNERSVQSVGVKDLHCTANAMICDCNKLTKTGESINMFVDAWISTCLLIFRNVNRINSCCLE